MQRLLELPKGMIRFDDVNNKGQTGYDVAKAKGHTAIVGLLAKAGHAA